MSDDESKDLSANVEKEEEEKGVVTMMDVLKDEQELEADAHAVLGSASETVCSYNDGYMPRQPLYACTTCSQPSNPDFKPAGVCLACSYQCHEGHSLVELYTKRQFRCDCGTKILSERCKLQPNKEENTKNTYNQNFKGVYCECSRPYPDAEDTVDDCMVQCLLCEDWYHGRHLGVDSIPEDSSYSEMICRGCVSKYTFLQHYSGWAVQQVKKDNLSDEDIDCHSLSDNKPNENVQTVNKTESAKDVAEPSSSVCLLHSLPLGGPSTLFMLKGWREELCSCPSCTKLYTDTNTTHLTQDSDTVHFYEAQAKQTRGQFEQGMEALGQLDRVRQVEAIHTYNNMKENLMDYLAKFANNKKVVREEDIKEFFEEMKANKKPRVGGGPPPSCK